MLMEGAPSHCERCSTKLVIQPVVGINVPDIDKYEALCLMCGYAWSPSNRNAPPEYMPTDKGLRRGRRRLERPLDTDG